MARSLRDRHVILRGDHVSRCSGHSESPDGRGCPGDRLRIAGWSFFRLKRRRSKHLLIPRSSPFADFLATRKGTRAGTSASSGRRSHSTPRVDGWGSFGGLCHQSLLDRTRHLQSGLTLLCRRHRSRGIIARCPRPQGRLGHSVKNVRVSRAAEMQLPVRAPRGRLERAFRDGWVVCFRCPRPGRISSD